MQVREKLIQLLEASSYTQRKVADKTGLSGATISQYLKGSYNGNIENIEATLRDFLSREDERARRREVKATFVPTRLARLALGLISNTHSDGDIGVIYGPAGMGKSMVLKEYVRANSANKGVILIEADPGCTAKVLLQSLCERLGVRKNGNIHELSEECIQALSGKGWLVLVDEAELLPYKALEVLRRVHDRSGVAIVLAGMPRLLINLKGSRGEYAQLYSRVGMALDLEAHKGKSEVEDFNAILASLLPDEVGDSGNKPGIAEAFLKHSKGNYRRMFKLARGVARASVLNESGISLTLIESYAAMLIH
ncbi:AAA family ATPase [Pantoea sp. BAV 3049]|uniref:AAA family ATPase n=1 Tax=Pantoea sp. BAV 3049 TaxID=2654188 RepID=UPI00131D2884|nr:AAA family ATPase [Pantoea sp. BAV 3049]